MLKLARATVEHLEAFLVNWISKLAKPKLQFQKYRVAPRLGIDNVRRRLLRDINARESLADPTHTI
jgi:hypothetical protein